MRERMTCCTFIDMESERTNMIDDMLYLYRHGEGRYLGVMTHSFMIV
jgi:exoribonuclease II